jgi:uridine monophosphate synthetase
MRGICTYPHYSYGIILRRDELFIRLMEIGAVKFGSFKLKSGRESPYYIDLRMLPSNIDVLRRVGEEFANLIKDSQLRVDRICGIPLAGVSLATSAGMSANIPVIYTRKEPIVYKELARSLEKLRSEGKMSDENGSLSRVIEYINELSGFKTYGIARYVDGEMKDGERIAILDDLITTAGSKIETKELIMLEAKRRNIQVTVDSAYVFVDREEGGRENLEKEGIRLYSVAKISEIAEVLRNMGKISEEQYGKISSYLGKD